MENLLLKQTSTETWQALVQESAIKASVLLSHELESYLVFLLMRFSKMPTLCMSVLAIEYLTIQTTYTGMQKEHLRDLGDKCLLFSGLFPGQARHKNVSVDYFVQLGRTAYLDLADMTHDTLSQLYLNLSAEFITLMEVLLASWEQKAAHTLLPTEITQTLAIIRRNKPWRSWH